MADPSANGTNDLGVTIRRLLPAEAAGVTELVRSVYEDSYYPTDLYDPARIVELNESGKLISIVAVNPAGEIVGHYALERSAAGTVAEASDAMVRPEYRHHHILEDMRVELREEAIREGLIGLVGYPVTNHTFTQKAEDHFGAFPCGLALGLWPQTFHNMPEPMTQRMSFAIYFKFLQRRERVEHVATPHQQMIARIYEQYDRPVEVREDAPASGKGTLTVEFEKPLGTGSIHVERIGEDTCDAIAQACRNLLDASDTKAITLELPLSQNGVAEVCRAAEQLGFFFSGLGPAFAGEDDMLILQLPREEIDVLLLQIEHPFTKDLLAYVVDERTRVQAACNACDFKR